MASIVVEEKGCRDCALCVDICPTRVLERDEPKGLARVAREQDCIGCTSCQYICPSRCITVSDIAVQKPYFRIEQNVAIVERLLQCAPASSSISDDEVRAALVDISFRLKALSDSVTETMGRGGRAVGRKAGALAAEHLPEMYEGGTIEQVLSRMRQRFEGSFDFEPVVKSSGSELTMVFAHCAMRGVVARAGGKTGEHVLCQLFHEYWAGLVGAFLGRSYAIEMTEVGERCTMRLAVRN